MEHGRSTPAGLDPESWPIDPDAAPPSIRVMAYRDGELVDEEVADPRRIPELRPDGGVLWVHVEGACDRGTLLDLAELFALHPLAVTEIAETPQRPKVEIFDRQQVFIGRTARLGERFQIEACQLSVVVGHDYVLTFQERKGPVLSRVRNHLRNDRAGIRGRDAAYLTYSILDAVIDSYFPLLERLGARLHELEEEAMLAAGPHTIHRINEARRAVDSLWLMCLPMRDALSSFARDSSRFLGEDVRLYLRDCHDHGLEVYDVLNSYRNTVNAMINTYLTVLSNRTNDVMRVLTVIASIFIPLTFVAGVYGMNFQHMPELDEPYAYPILIGVMSFVAVLMLVFFHRRGWFTWTSPSRRPDEHDRPPR